MRVLYVECDHRTGTVTAYAANQLSWSRNDIERGILRAVGHAQKHGMVLKVVHIRNDFDLGKAHFYRYRRVPEDMSQCEEYREGWECGACELEARTGKVVHETDVQLREVLARLARRHGSVQNTAAGACV
jgi:hypothetical protein